MVFQEINRWVRVRVGGGGGAASLVPMQARSSDKSKMAVNLYSLIKKNFIVRYLMTCFTVHSAQCSVGSRNKRMFPLSLFT